MAILAAATLTAAAAAEAERPVAVAASAQEVPRAPTQQAAEPPLRATPQDPCGPGSRPETGLQGRVSPEDHASGRATKGFTCNTRAVGHYGAETPIGTVGGFKVERYVDADGHECAYYDTTLLYPTNALDQEGGVNVLDMSDPANPMRTARLITPAMQSPHESLVVSQQRGVLAAVAGSALFLLGQIDVYDISQDCRHPVLKSSSPVGVVGHESGLSPDGLTFYSASPGTSTIVAVDLTNTSAPVPLWAGDYDSHGLSISSDGNRAYVAGINSGLIILDTSEIQARVPNPQVTEIARLQWKSMSIPQNAIPVTIKGKPYVVEIDEFGTLDEVGAGRIIDISDETHPRVISNLRLEVHQPKNFDEISGDTGAQLSLQGYAGHYCNVPSRVDPGIVACSMILSGLRVFDIRDPKHPREIAYFNAPNRPRDTPGFDDSSWAMSSPSFAPERREIWYSDGFSGFWAVRADNGVWPFPDCGSREATISGLARRKVGTPRADRIVGRGGSARVAGRNGSDRISARGGNDHVCARSGADLVSAGKGDDFIRGQRGADRLTGGPGDDYVHGGYGRDRVAGGPGADTLVCGRGPADLAIADRTDKVSHGCERVRVR